jgi:hypothetical protein
VEAVVEEKCGEVAGSKKLSAPYIGAGVIFGALQTSKLRNGLLLN